LKCSQAVYIIIAFFSADHSPGHHLGNYAILTSGLIGGITFRASNGAFSDLSQYYYLLIGTDGSFSLYLRNDSASNFNQTLSSGTGSSIHTGLNQSNFVAVAAHGSTLDLYVNKQLIASVNDSAYSHGTIGVFAYDSGHPNNEANPPVVVVFSNARVWTL
jgi:hypothetical protein